MIIDLNTWNLGNKTFASSEKLCEYISLNGTQYQSRIQERLKSDAVYKKWKKTSHPIKDTPFYSLYRKSEESKNFHASSNAILSSVATPKDLIRHTGLSNEITNSPVVLKAGQKLFHGRYLDTSNINFPSLYLIPSFLSCSLCPEVAAWHAISKAGQYSTASNATVFIITLTNECPAIFGAKGNLIHEQELLLLSHQTLNLTGEKIIVAGSFNIIFATLTYAP